MAKKVIVYQMWAPSWVSFAEMTRHLRRVATLGCTHVWLSGVLESPWCDHGYDVSHHYHVNGRFAGGNPATAIRDFDNFVTAAHLLGLKVVIDLILNHTSTDHPWFRNNPELYCWSEDDRPGWQNLFDGGSAWKYSRRRKSYYLHLFHKKQADLKWFEDNGEINQTLVDKFQGIVYFWTKRHKVDGFRLDVPQALNKNLGSDALVFDDLIFGDKDDRVLNAVFPDRDKAPFLMMECFDPTFGELVNHYVDETPVQYVMNVMLKETITAGEHKFLELVKGSEEHYGFMLNTEDHDSPRFTSRSNLSVTEALFHLFNSQAAATCIYQGQELGLRNPSQDILTDAKLCELDAQTAMRAQRGDSLKALRPTSRANARVPLPLYEYDRQLTAAASPLRLTRELIARYHRL